MQGNYPVARARGQTALREHQSRGDARGITVTLMVLGNDALQCGDLASAATLYSEAARRLRDLRSPIEAVALLQCGLVAGGAGDVDLLRRLIAEIEVIDHAGRQTYVRAGALHLKALVAVGEGKDAAAATLLEQALALWRPARNQSVRCDQ